MTARAFAPAQAAPESHADDLHAARQALRETRLIEDALDGTGRDAMQRVLHRQSVEVRHALFALCTGAASTLSASLATCPTAS